MRTGDKAVAAEAATAVASSSSEQQRHSVVFEAKPRSHFRIWNDEELAAAKRNDPERPVLADTFSTFLVLLYSKYQAEVGRKVR